MIDQNLIENIKRYGSFKDTGEGRIKIIKDIGFRMDQKAEYAVISGCVQPEAMPQAFKALYNLLENLKIDYTLLSKEFCCGWLPMGQTAVITKNDPDIVQFREISRGFIAENFRQAETLGVQSIVLFCSACEPNYSNYKKDTKLNVLHYTELLNRYFQGGKLNTEVDYYAGCYRFRRKITDEKLDVEPAVSLLNKINCLKVNYLNNDLCCNKQPNFDELSAALKTKKLITICTGCYHSLTGKLTGRSDYSVEMLPQLLLESIK